MIPKWYSDLLHLHAAKWGLEVPEPRPLITDETSPYPKLTVIETFTWRDTQPHRYTEIALVTLNGLLLVHAEFSMARPRPRLPALSQVLRPVPNPSRRPGRSDRRPETRRSTARSADLDPRL